MENKLKKVKFVQLRSSGCTYSDISAKLEISKPTLIKWSKELETELFNEFEIQKEELKKKYNLDQESILKLKSKIIKKLESEVLGADLSSVPANKLLDILRELINDVPSSTSFKD